MTPDKIKTWWRATRSFSFPASIVPAMLGAVIWWAEGHPLNFWALLAAVVAVAAAHSGSNMINDYWDFLKGVDRPDTVGGGRVLVEGVLTPRQVLVGSMIAYAIAAAIALPFCLKIGWPFISLIVAGFVIGTGYVLPPIGLKYRALGDLAVFLAFGTGVTLGSYMMQSGGFSWSPVIYAIPFGMLIIAILLTNNIRDMEGDKAASFKFRTMASILGPRPARIYYALLIFGAYAVAIASILLKEVSVGAFAILLTLPLAFQAVRRVSNSSPDDGSSLVGADAQTAKLNMAFGIAMMAGMAIWPLCI